MSSLTLLVVGRAAAAPRPARVIPGLPDDALASLVFVMVRAWLAGHEDRSTVAAAAART